MAAANWVPFAEIGGHEVEEFLDRYLDGKDAEMAASEYVERNGE